MMWCRPLKPREVVTMSSTAVSALYVAKRSSNADMMLPRSSIATPTVRMAPRWVSDRLLMNSRQVAWAFEDRRVRRTRFSAKGSMAVSRCSCRHTSQIDVTRTLCSGSDVRSSIGLRHAIEQQTSLQISLRISAGRRRSGDCSWFRAKLSNGQSELTSCQCE